MCQDGPSQSELRRIIDVTVPEYSYPFGYNYVRLPNGSSFIDLRRTPSVAWTTYTYTSRSVRTVPPYRTSLPRGMGALGCRVSRLSK